MAQVFISYSRKDISFVEQLVADLKNVGLDVWYDVSGIRGGSRWRIEIETAIRKSQFVVVVLSPDSIASEWVEREFLFASNLEREIIPLMYRHCELTLNYLDLNYIDVQGEKYRQGFADLLKALAVDLGSMPLPRGIPFILKYKYVIAGVVLAVLIFAALLNSLFRGARTEPTLTSTVTALSTPTETATVTATEYLTATPIIVVVTSTEMPVTPPTPTFTPTLTLTSTPENTATASPSPEPKANKMTALLQSSDDEGKAPLKVNFDARASYVQFSDGSTPSCGNNSFCSYDFSIYHNSKLVEKRGNNTGMLSYAFGTKGQYFITVYVCRGNACDDDGVTVNVK
jgi:hypothetical protein